MSYKILATQRLSPEVVRMRIEAPDVARRAQPGQFIVIMTDETGERIPLTIADQNRQEGTVTIIFQEVGYSTMTLGRKNPGDQIWALLGPLGHPTDIRRYGSVLCVAGGVGIAEILPVARALKGADNNVISIIGARSSVQVILRQELESASHALYITTDDGTLGRKGRVTDCVTEELSQKQYDLVYTVGPVPMMKAVADITRGHAIKTVASVNPLMVDATGMCGVCRCKVNGKTVFGCVDGPEFDAHALDFDDLARRLSFFSQEEQNAKSQLAARKQS